MKKKQKKQKKKHISGFASASLNVHVYMRLSFERIEFGAKM
jgi:hypothetical protein